MPSSWLSFALQASSVSVIDPDQGAALLPAESGTVVKAAVK